MATTYTAGAVASTVQARAGTDITAVFETYEITAALVINDVIEMVKVPAGATVLYVSLASDDLDTASSPAITLDVGDGGDHDRYISVSTIAQGGGVAVIDEVDGLGYTYTSADTIDIKVHAAPTTGATSGTLNLVVIYTMQPTM